MQRLITPKVIHKLDLFVIFLINFDYQGGKTYQSSQTINSTKEDFIMRYLLLTAFNSFEPCVSFSYDCNEVKTHNTGKFSSPCLQSAAINQSKGKSWKEPGTETRKIINRRKPTENYNTV